MNRTLLDFWVGLFVAIGLAALLFLALKVGNAGSLQKESDTYTITAAFDNIGGLKTKAPVKSAGVVIGRVSNITLDSKRHQAIVTMKIGSEFPFSTDTSAEILTSGLLGEQYIGLESGGLNTNLKNGDALDPALVSSAIIMERALTQFMLDKSSEKSDSSSLHNAPAEKDPLE